MTDPIQASLELVSVLGNYLAGRDFKNIRYCCPFCAKRKKSKDTKYHFHIYPHDAFGICYKCGYKGSLREIYRDLGLEAATAGLLSTLGEWEAKIKHFLLGDDPDEPEEEIVKAVLPADFKPLKNFEIEYRYLMSRGLTPDEIDSYHFGTSMETPGYVLCCDYDTQGNLTYWQGRKVWGQGNKNKYHNPPKVNSKRTIFNYYRCLDQEEIVVTEGIFSAISAGSNAICTYGKDISQEQVCLIRELPAKRIFIALDPDARKEAVKLAKSLFTEKEVWMVGLLEGDPNDIGKGEFLQLKKEAVLFDPIYGMKYIVEVL